MTKGKAKKNKLSKAVMIPLLGAVGLVGAVSIAYACDDAEATQAANQEDQSKAHEHEGEREANQANRMRQGENSQRREPAAGHRALFEGHANEMKAIMESGDFDAFIALISENLPEDVELTDERLERMESHFSDMSERFQSGEFSKSKK